MKLSKGIGPVGIIALLAVGYFMFRCSEYKSYVAERAALPANTATAAPAPVAESATWWYGDSVDVITSKTRKTASIDADQSLSLDFPYKGKNVPKLLLRKTGNSTDVMVLIEKGQIICHERPCSVRVRFDDGAPILFDGSMPTDHSTTAVFLSPEKKFVERVRKSKKTLVELVIHQAGNQVLEFKTADLKWN